MPDKLVLFPGWGFSPMVMKNLAEQLNKSYQTSIMDLSEPLEIIRTRIPDNATIIGWSLGGLFALALAQIMPIKKIIMIASNPCFIAQEDWPGIDPEFFKQFSQEVELDCDNALKKFTYLQVQGTHNEKEAYKQIKPYLSKLTATTQLLHILKQDLRSNLASLSCELHFILSQKDPLVPIDLANKIKALKQEAHISILENASHASVMFNIEAIINHVN